MVNPFEIELGFLKILGSIGCLLVIGSIGCLMTIYPSSDKRIAIIMILVNYQASVAKRDAHLKSQYHRNLQDLTDRRFKRLKQTIDQGS